MKLKMIALAAMLAAGSANATIVDGVGGNGEMFMTLLDQEGQISYVLDMNITMDDFMANMAAPGASYNYAADANMASFLSMVAPANQSGLLFAIGAMDTKGTNVADHHRYITTASVIDENVDTNLDLKQLGNLGSQFLGNVNGMLLNDVSLIVTDPSLVGYAGSTTWGTNWGSAFNGTSTGLIGNDLGMYLFEQTDGAFGVRNNPSTYSAISQGGFPVYANLDMDGNLTMSVAAVPEAETYAMMLAGLGLVGFMVARRRKAA